MNLDAQIRDIIDRVSKEITRAVREDISTQIRGLVGGNGTAARGRGAQKSTAAKPAGRRRRGIDEKSIEAVFQYVSKNPGKRSEEIQKSAGVSPEVAKKALAKLREGGRVKMKGTKRAATYTA